MTKVFAINGAKNVVLNSTTVSSNKAEVVAELDQEKFEHSLRADRITEDLWEIITNTSSKNTSLPLEKFLLYCIIGILIPFSYLCYLTLIPVHDLLRYPEYWYEQFLTPVGIIPTFAACILINCSFLMNIKRIKNLKNFGIGLFAGILSFGAMGGFMELWATSGYYKPVPFSGFLGGYSIAMGNYISVWFSFPKNWRNNFAFRKRLQYFLVAFAISNILTVQYNVIAKFLLVYKDNYQWIIALTLPIFCEFNEWIVTLLSLKACNGDTMSVKVACAHLMGTRHALFLSVTLGSIATVTSSRVILASDFIMNLAIVGNIIRTRKKYPQNADKQISLLQSLILNEMIEFVVPLVYCLCFSTAYLGPNANVIGNVGNSYFQFNKVENFKETIENIATFFLVDVLSLISNSLILWIFARINVYRAVCVYLKEYGVIFTINLTFILNIVSIQIRKSFMNIYSKY